MNILFREVQIDDKEFILEAHKEINQVSGLSESHFSENIDRDLFQNKICKVIIAEVNRECVGFLLYSYLYFADSGCGIYLSQAYVKDEYRKQGLLRQMLEELETREKECNFIMDFVGKENKVMMQALGKLGFVSSDMITYYRKIRK